MRLETIWALNLDLKGWPTTFSSNSGLVEDRKDGEVPNLLNNN